MDANDLGKYPLACGQEFVTFRELSGPCGLLLNAASDKLQMLRERDSGREWKKKALEKSTA